MEPEKKLPVDDQTPELQNPSDMLLSEPSHLIEEHTTPDPVPVEAISDDIIQPVTPHVSADATTPPDVIEITTAQEDISVEPAEEIVPQEAIDAIESSHLKETPEVSKKIGDYYTPTEVIKTVPVFVPHPAHSAFRTVMLTLIVLLFVAGAGLAWMQRDRIMDFFATIQAKYLSGAMPIIPEIGDGETAATDTAERYDFSGVAPIPLTSLALTDGFVGYREIPLDVTPKVPPYKVNTGLTNIKGREYFMQYFPLSASDMVDLKAHAFVVNPQSGSNEFFSLYENNRYNKIPNFISTDSILHNYHLLFGHLLKTLEEEKLAFILRELNTALVSDAKEIFDTVESTPWEMAARRNLGFFTVGSVLLDPSVGITREVSVAVNQELELIKNKAGIAPSVIINEGLVGGAPLLEDYTQYIPRGHYAGNALLEQYFKSMMWYGRLGFRLKNEDEVRSSVLITLMLRDTANQTYWSSISDPIDFFVGKGDDIGFREMEDLVVEVYGADVTLASMIAAPEKFATLMEKTKTLRSPEINSMPIFNAEIQPDRDEEIRSFRFFGQRFTLDAQIFQKLIYREVGTIDKPRLLPTGLDIASAFGSAEAASILEKTGVNDYENYSENMKQVQTFVAGLNKDTWTQNLYWGWLYTIKTLTGGDKKGYPAFMQNQAWTRKELNTFLASWAELKHDTILYAKQVYAELGGGGDDEVTPPDDRGYVEPNPALYARLAGLLAMTREGLDAKKLLSDSMRDNLSKMETLTLSLKTISEKELRNETLTDEEYELIRSYGGQLEHLWLEVNRASMAKENLDARNFLNQNPAAIISDVATDPNGQVLQVGTGAIMDIYVAVPVDGVLKLTRGGVFSYYEFPWPMNDRLTDKKWRSMMGITFEDGETALPVDQQPTQPAWTHTFMGEKQ